MGNEKLIASCPVCDSTMLSQEQEDKFLGDSIIRFRTGSYCEGCGARNKYNCKSAEQVQSELADFVASIKSR